MGSPIEAWEGVAAYFTGAGGGMPLVWMLIALVVTVASALSAFFHENKSYRDHCGDPH
jgi:hypothetical protein